MERDGLQQFMNQSRHRILSREEERRLAVRKDAGDKTAFDELVMHNVRLVYSLARRYHPGPLPLDDLLQEGMLGLMHAVGKFDPERGFKLTTYATWWIRQALQRAIYNKGRTIRLPTHVAERLDRMNRAHARLEAKLGRTPTDEEVAKQAKLTVKQVAELREVMPPALSLDGFAREDGSPVEIDALAVEDDEPDFTTELVAKDDLRSALDALTERERAVIEMRYGLVDDNAMTLEAIGNQLGVTRERVRQIETQALARLRVRLAA